MKFLKTIYYSMSNLNLFSKELFKSKLTKLLKYRPKMEFIDLQPPSTVRNMTSLDKSAFTKVITVPSITIHIDHLSKTIKKSKKYFLKFCKFNSVVTPNGNEESRQILLNPALIKSEEDIKTLMDIDLEVIKGKFSSAEVTVNYENWKCDQVLRSVLPENMEGCSGYSIVGHILHLNLREHLHPYKSLIAQVYLDKTPNVSLVVNKVDIIDNSDNTFRSFSMEKLAGDKSNTVTTVKENNCTFTFDFSKVYWNPRLSTEHERIINKLKKGDILFDIMAGVGPFAIPAGKKKCIVFANDLNPFSYEALKGNCTSNKVADHVKCFNMDGNDFIRDIIPSSLKNDLKDDFTGDIHFTMNLPSIAVNFLPSFIGIYTSENVPSLVVSEDKRLIVHVYLFSFNETKEFAVHTVASKLGFCLKELEFTENIKSIDTEVLRNNIQPHFWDYIIEIVNVRRVAPAKIMFRVSFHLPSEVLVKDVDKENLHSQPQKKQKVAL
ncbi:UNVERIFIED_CONTAM: hypothetical protein GTU68_019094 [Idotea baltica]|nr:hypothetical protein [Idotea baltica]